METQPTCPRCGSEDVIESKIAYYPGECLKCFNLYKREAQSQLDAAPGSAATVPLPKIIEHMISEARRERAQQGKKILKYNAGFYDGEEFALGKLLETVCPKPPN